METWLMAFVASKQQQQQKYVKERISVWILIWDFVVVPFGFCSSFFLFFLFYCSFRTTIIRTLWMLICLLHANGAKTMHKENTTANDNQQIDRTIFVFVSIKLHVHRICLWFGYFILLFWVFVWLSVVLFLRISTLNIVENDSKWNFRQASTHCTTK